MQHIGFIGLGNVGARLAGSVLRNGFDLTVRDLDSTLAQPFIDQGASFADSLRQMAESVDVVITSPVISFDLFDTRWSTGQEQ